jgi:DNA-binding MarR family transcriptional regulator
MPRDMAATSEARQERAIDLSRLEAMVGYNVHILDLFMYQLFFARFAVQGMTPGVFSTLLAIKDNPGARHGALADALMIQRPNMTTLVNRLVRQGYVKRRGASDDQRSVVLSLAPKGERALGEVLAEMPAHEDNLAAGLDARERRSLLALLRKLAKSARPAAN